MMTQKKTDRPGLAKQRVVHLCSVMLLLAVLAFAPAVCLAHTAEDPQISPLITVITGQNIPVGEAWIWNNDQNLYVKYHTDRPWYMTATHLYVGRALPSLPINPGGFPYKHENLDNVLEDPYTIPLSELGVGPGDPVYIVAQAAVVNVYTGVSDTAWKKGIPLGGGGAMYNTYQIQKIPWIKVSISETELIWDIFKSGRYMSLGPIFRIASNVAVAILYGTGGPDSAMGPAVRTRTLLPKTRSNWRTSYEKIGLCATFLWGAPSRPHGGSPELVPPAGQTSSHPADLFSHWIDFIHLDGYQMRIPESEGLKKGKAFSWYNMISVDPSNTEGRYFEQFVITIFAAV